MKNPFCRICGSRIQIKHSPYRYSTKTGKPSKVIIIIRCPNSTQWFDGHDLHYLKRRVKKIKYEGEYNLLLDKSHIV